MAYDHQNIEKKWQKYWEENKVFKTENGGAKPKKYILDMFPYPSGAGLHVGHPKGYTATDIVSRYYHATGHNVLHTMGFDAFGLPAENYAIKTGTHPAITTAENIGVFTEQLRALGFSYDWDRMVDTTDPEYYRWTQWIFLELFKKGLAYEQDLPINYCPSCKTGLANEEVTSMNACDRCGTRVERRAIRQWVLRITEYADRLLSDMDTLDWPEGIKEMQRNWIGRSEGCEFRMMKKIDNKKGRLPLSANGGVHNGLAKSSSRSIIFESLQKVNTKIKFSGSIEGQIIGDDNKKISFRSKDILAHFRGKNKKEFIQRAGFLGTVFSLIDQVHFDQMNHGYFFYKNIVIKIVLGQQSNGNYFVKTYYVADRLTEEYRNLLQQGSLSISVYTTRVDTVYGMTYAVLAPDHPQVRDFITTEQKAICEAYIEIAKGESDQDRTNEGKEKTGVFTGSYVVNPFNGESVPLWIADYVLGSYGTGAVMAVPAHDERDFEFAKKYDLEIKQSIAPKIIGVGPLTPREGIETHERIFVNAIIEHDGKFLLLKEAHGYKFVGGGVDEGENPMEAYGREIIEETGYDDFEVINFVLNSAYYGFAYRNPKNINQTGYDLPFVHITLNSLHNIGISEHEKSVHSVEWVEKSEVASLLISNGHENAWNLFLTPRAKTEDGYLINSGEYTKLSSFEARRVFSEKAEAEGFGHKKINFKLRDWLFSRQRYWGEPIPLIHISNEDYAKLPRIENLEDAKMGEASVIARNEAIQVPGTLDRYASLHSARDDGPRESLVIDGKIFSDIYTGITGKLIIDSRLPITLPDVKQYEPAGDGQSPLATVPQWVNVKLADNLNGKRETNTMPQWGGSCWYYLRYMDPHNSEALASQEALDYWGMVDEYVGGAEHAVLHLLYARFWHKVLYDIGVVPHAEPFQKLTNVGLILGPDGNKMSKSKGNVINPNVIVQEYGADTLRLYEMSMSAFTDAAPWDPKAIIGVRRFLDKVYSAFTVQVELKNENNKTVAISIDGSHTYRTKDDMKSMKLLHKTIKKVGEDIVDYKFNTAISTLQILINEGVPVDPEFSLEWQEKFLILLHPFAPHIAEELWNKIWGDSMLGIYNAPWPSYDEWMLFDDEVTIAIQINGKLRGTYTGLNGVMQDEVSVYAHETLDISKWLENKILVKEIFIPNKLLSIVVKDA